MKREEKHALSRQRILDAALQEFSTRGYDSASLNTVCAENGISKGIIYHYFKDKDELYLYCVSECFGKLTDYLSGIREQMSGSIEHCLQAYFTARLRFFADHPCYLGIFISSALNPPVHLLPAIADARRCFDELNIAVLTALLEGTTLRDGLQVPNLVEDFRMYLDYFNMRFKHALDATHDPEQVLKNHEERCYRQLSILLYGVLGHEHENDEKRRSGIAPVHSKAF